MDEDYIHGQHTVHHMLYHLLFCPKRRKKVLVGPVHDRLKEIIEQVAQEHAWTIVQLAIGPNPVHSNQSVDLAHRYRTFGQRTLLAWLESRLAETSVFVDTFDFLCNGWSCQPRGHSKLYREAKLGEEGQTSVDLRVQN